MTDVLVAATSDALAQGSGPLSGLLHLPGLAHSHSAAKERRYKADLPHGYPWPRSPTPSPQVNIRRRHLKYCLNVGTAIPEQTYY